MLAYCSGVIVVDLFNSYMYILTFMSKVELKVADFYLYMIINRL